MNMALVESREINNALVEGFYGEKQAWFSRKQVGEALGYADPVRSIGVIHFRHKERLEPFSRVLQIDTPSGKQEGFMYNIKGVLEICRWSKQPKAHEVMDAIWDMAESVMQKGYFSTISDEELYRLLGDRLGANKDLIVRTYTRINPSTIPTVVPLCTVSDECVHEHRAN